MSYNLQKCIEHLNRGLEYKRIGDFSNALKEYFLAISNNPTYKHLYNNIAKVLFVEPSKQNERLLYFLTYAHLTLINDNYSLNNVVFAKDNGFYSYQGYYLPNIYMSGDYCYQRVVEEPNLGKIYADVNLTFNTGLAYILRNKTLISHNEIPNDIILNHIKLITGKEYDGITLGESRFASMIRVIGFVFLIDNMTISNSPEFASTVYFKKNYNIDDF